MVQSSAWLLAALMAGLLAASACSDSERPGGPPGSVEGGQDSGGLGAKAGSTSAGAGEADGGSTVGDAGEPGTGEGGASGSATAGSSAGGTSGSNPGGGSVGYAGEPSPPVGDPPICMHGAQFEAGTLIELSGAGDDLLQAVTPSELTIAWKNGDAFYVADRDDASLPFGPALAVAGGSQYNSVGLSPDGLLLVGLRKDLSAVEMVRGVGQAFDDPNPGAGDFEEFNTTRATIPLSNQVLTDAVVAANDAAFFFSHYASTQTGSRATVRESLRDGGFWSFTSVDLGQLLYANSSQRRIPTGVSSDLLTLFYRDEVEGDFRAAWRVNTQVQFDYSEVLDLGNGVQAAAPNATCSRVYFSAQGDTDLDLFVASVTQ